MTYKNLYIKESELDFQQKQICYKKIDQDLVVTGGAGSGKSILALWKAKAIAEKGGRFLVVVKTVALQRYMWFWGNQLGLNNGDCFRFNKCFDWKSSGAGYIKGPWQMGFYDYIILDEATDLTANDIKELKSHCRYLLVFGDDNQQLYDFNVKKAQIKEIEAFLQQKIDRLVYNHRLPKKLAYFASYFYPAVNFNENQDEFVKRCVNEGLELPHLQGYPNREAEFSEIIRIIRNKNGGLKDVGILFRRSEDVKEAFDFFNSQGIICSSVIESKEQGDLLNPDIPKILTYHSSKGLQFETVFLPDVKDLDPQDFSFYVALTRSYASLYIMYLDQMPKMFKKVPRNLYTPVTETDNSVADTVEF